MFWGAIVGAGIGVAGATLFNMNCDSFIETAEGCYRANVLGIAAIGAVCGALWLRFGSRGGKDD